MHILIWLLFYPQSSPWRLFVFRILPSFLVQLLWRSSASFSFSEKEESIFNMFKVNRTKVFWLIFTEHTFVIGSMSWREIRWNAIEKWLGCVHFSGKTFSSHGIFNFHFSNNEDNSAWIYDKIQDLVEIEG